MVTKSYPFSTSSLDMLPAHVLILVPIPVDLDVDDETFRDNFPLIFQRAHFLFSLI